MLPWALLLLLWAAAGLELRRVADPRAVCNDGSPQVYYERPGKSGVAILHLQGGWWAWDQASLEQRWKTQPYLMSSREAPPTLQLGGLLDPSPTTNPEWADAHVVVVAYCSSDVFAGQAGEGFGWRFSGRLGLAAVLDQVDLSADHTVLFSGCSAGAQAVVGAADWVRARLPRHRVPCAGRRWLDDGRGAGRRPRLVWPADEGGCRPLERFRFGLAGMLGGPPDEASRVLPDTAGPALRGDSTPRAVFTV